MNIKDYNKIRTAIFGEVMKNEEIAEAVTTSGCAIVYEATQGDKHAVFVLTRTTQMNDNTLKKEGFIPEATSVKRILTVQRSTKCVYF